MKAKSHPPAPAGDLRHSWSLAIAGALYASALLVAAARPGSATWGFDLLAYLPRGERASLIALLLVSVGLLVWAAVRGGRRSDTRAAAHGSRRAERRSPRRSPVWLRFGLLLPLLTAGMWLLRDRVHLLGDGLVWIDMVQSRSRPLYSEPLAAAALYGFVALTAPFHHSSIPTALAAFSIVCGALATTLYYPIAREIGASSARGIALALLLTLGLNQLYFGYIESYPFVSVAILVYLWTLLRHVDGHLSLGLVSVALAVAISSHLITLLLAPSFIFLVFRTRRSWIRTTALLAMPAALVAIAVVVLRYPISSVLAPIRLVTGAGGAANPNPMESVMLMLRRLPHLVNLCLLIAPVPLLIALTGLIRTRSKTPKPDAKTMALLPAAVSGLFVAIVLSTLVFPGHDWDLVAMALIPGIVLAVKLGAERLARAPRPAALGLSGLGVVGLLAFVLVNANEASALRRYDALLGAKIPLSAHERAYGNERMVKAYAGRGDPATGLGYALRALEADSANVRYWANVGSALYNLRRYEEAAHYFEGAAERGTKLPDVFYYLSQCRMRQSRLAEAREAAQRAIDLGGEELKYLFNLGLARAMSGDQEGARIAWDRVLERWPGDGRTRQAYDQFLGAKSPGIE